MAQLIIGQIKCFEITNTNPPIQLPRIETTLKLTPVNPDPGSIDQIKHLEIINGTPPHIQPSRSTAVSTSTSDNLNLKSTRIVARTSGRTRKQPTTRGDDFLWIDCIPPQV
jgi:hypothetical protein